jgi:hypothetical protein
VCVDESKNDCKKMIFQIFLLDVKGKVLIARNYRGEIDSNVIDKFMPLLMEKGELQIDINRKKNVQLNDKLFINSCSTFFLLFYRTCNKIEEEGLVTPILQTQECTFAYVKTNNLYLVSTTKKNANIGKKRIHIKEVSCLLDLIKNLL